MEKMIYVSNFGSGFIHGFLAVEAEILPAWINCEFT
jgi:hypothetical protein